METWISRPRTSTCKALSIEIDNRNDRANYSSSPNSSCAIGTQVGGPTEPNDSIKYRSRFDGVTYTSCDPENRVWYLRAGELEIDYETGIGSATHATLYFQDVPFLYLPYFQFPIDDRRVMSGLLSVKTGYSETSGRSLW